MLSNCDLVSNVSPLLIFCRYQMKCKSVSNVSPRYITSGDAAMCKYFCANAAFEVVDTAMQVLGGVGIAGNHRITRFWRDLRVDRVSGGSDEMQILTLGRAVLKQYR